MTARAIVKDDETEKTVLALPCQDEMTDLDLDEMTDLVPPASPILNTSRGKCSVPWTVCVWVARRLSGLLDTARKQLEHHRKVHGITQGACHQNVQRLQPVPRPPHELRVRQEGLVVRPDLLPRDRKAAKTIRTRRTRPNPRKSKGDLRY